jgi:hypothetical protein
MNILIGQGGDTRQPHAAILRGPKWTLTPKILLGNFRRNNFSVTFAAETAIVTDQQPCGP